MADQLNVVLAVVGCARADHVSCYGYARETMPFLDQVAREGVRFSRMIAAAPSALPAHASLFTGLHAASHGATEEGPFLSPRHKTLAEHLKAAGYRTAAFCPDPWVSPETGLGRGFDAFFTQRYHNRVAAQAISWGRRASDRLLRRSDSGARRTNHALRRWVAASDQPFFAFVHYNETHLPLHPPRPYDHMYLPRGVTAARVRAVNQDSSKYLAGEVDMGEEDFAILRALYDGGLRYADMRLREVADVLRAAGQWERTLLVITGSHGENLGEHGLMGHKWGLYDTLLRVPLVLRCPLHVPQGYVIDELAQTSDILPTILRVLGLAVENGSVHGRPLIEQGRATPGVGFAIAERFRPNLARLQQRFPGLDVRPFDLRQKAIRTRREKFIWQSDEANRLYDVIADPGEECNLIEDQAQRAAALRRQLFDWLASVEQSEAVEQASALGPGMHGQLRALGDVD
jgi:arylsulfatase A-like enzyme